MRVDLLLRRAAGRVADLPDGSPTIAVKSPMISTAMWPRSWNRRSRRSTTAKPRWMSEAVGSMPSLTRSGAPRSSFVAQLGLGDDVDRARGQQLAAGGRRPRRATVTNASARRFRGRVGFSRTCGEAAVDGDDRAVDERRRGQREVEHHVRDLFGIAVAPQRDAPAGEPLLRVVGDRRGHAGADRARADAVDGDALRAELARERTCEPDDAVLARRCTG